MGEIGYDTGGPTRKFWRILSDEIEKKYFWGNSTKKVFLHPAENIAQPIIPLNPIEGIF